MIIGVSMILHEYVVILIWQYFFSRNNNGMIIIPIANNKIINLIVLSQLRLTMQYKIHMNTIYIIQDLIFLILIISMSL